MTRHPGEPGECDNGEERQAEPESPKPWLPGLPEEPAPDLGECLLLRRVRGHGVHIFTPVWSIGSAPSLPQMHAEHYLPKDRSFPTCQE